jgi:hypothetical protein
MAVGAVHDFHVHPFFLGNYLDPAGPYWAAGNGHPAAIFPDPVWWPVVAVACGSGVLLAGVLARQLPGVDPLLGLFLLLVLGGTVLTGVSGQPVFDRYWLMALPSLLAVVLAGRPELSGGWSRWVRRPERLTARLPVRPLAGAVCAGLVLLTLAVTAAGLAYDTARWRAGRQMVASGVPADDVDAGLEWRGYHSAAGMAPGDDWNFPGTTPCYVVSAVPRAGQRPVRVLAYRTFLVAGTSRLWVYDDRAQSPKTCRV